MDKSSSEQQSRKSDVITFIHLFEKCGDILLVLVGLMAGR